MRLQKTHRRYLVAAMLAVAGPAFAQERVTLDVLLPNERTTAYYPHVLARELGYFEEEGIDLNLLSSATTVPYVAFLSNGDADLVVLDSSQVLQAVNTGQPVKVIYEDMQFAPETIFVSADSDIETIADLEGKTIGLVSDRDRVTAQVALGSAGLTLDDVETAVVGEAGPTLANAFRNQTVAAVAGGVSDVSAVEAIGIEVRNLTPEEVSDNPANSFAMWAPREDELHDAVQRFLRAWVKGAEAALIDRDFAVAILKDEFPEQYEQMEVGVKLLELSADTLRAKKTELRGDVRPDVWQRIQAPYIDMGEIGGELDPATFLDGSYIEAANDVDPDAVRADIEAYREANPDRFQ